MHTAQKFTTHSVSSRLLGLAANFWFLIALLGQWIFVIYLCFAYFLPISQGDLLAMNKVMPHGYVAGDTFGNLAAASHVLLAIIIMGTGPLQLVPKIRKLLPKFHHWNGRIYLISVVIVSSLGAYMIWTRGTVGGMTQQIGITVDAILIIVFAGLTLKYALARKIEIHQRWAIRLFLVASAVWFYRIGLMFWLTINQGPVGFNMETFEGPFLQFLAFAQYLLPLAILEIYFFARQSNNFTLQISVALGLLIATLAMALGIFAATMGMWLPRIG